MWAAGPLSESHDRAVRCMHAHEWRSHVRTLISYSCILYKVIAILLTCS